MSGPMQRLAPVLALLYAASYWGLVWYPLRALEQAGLSGLWLSLVSYGVAAALVVPFYRRADEWRGQLGPLTALVLAAGWCNVAFILAMLDGPVVRVLLLFYLSPVWAVLLARLVLGERLRPEMSWVLAMALAGAALMLWDPVLGRPWPRSEADWLALSSGFGFALSNVILRRVSALSVIGKSLAMWIGVLVVSGVGLMLPAQEVPVVSVAGWFGAALLGVVGFLGATFAVAYGVSRMPVQRSAVILLFELVVGALSAALLAGEHLQAKDWFGGAMIIVAAYVASSPRSSVT